jgi:hypothetical protein
MERSYLVFLVDGAHERRGRWQHLIDEDEDGLLGAQLDALADHVDELAHGEIGGDEVLLLVDGRDVRLLDLLADDLLMAQSEFVRSEASGEPAAVVGACLPGCGRRTSGGCAQPLPCASRRGARP